ncbi:MAG: hypothetical protein V3S55_13435 [Nitrospiraceae bacterium]
MTPVHIPSLKANGSEGDCVYCGKTIKAGDDLVRSLSDNSKYYHNECFARMTGRIQAHAIGPSDE